jgi:phytoene desaturase
MKSIGIIGSGFAALSAACYLSKQGFKVSVYEKNKGLGGRARSFEAEGFTFDMGPSWYWMPDIFEKFFNDFGYSTADFYELKRIDPSYKIFFEDKTSLEIPASYQEIRDLFESIEPGSGEKLDQFLAEAKYKYEAGMNTYVRKPALSFHEFLNFEVISSFWKMDMFSSVEKQVHKLFQSDKLRQILKFPVLFLGATPSNTPALYTLMNYADIKLGTWYPMGGMSRVIDGFVSIAKENGVQFYTDHPVDHISVKANKAQSIISRGKEFIFDTIISGADYHHTEEVLLDEAFRSYDKSYWDSRIMAPSSLLFYVGLDRQVDGLDHHNLFFDKSFDQHAEEIYTNPEWPKEPLFYVCAPSKSDPHVAPKGCENLFILIPLAPDLEDDAKIEDHYFNVVSERIKSFLGIDIREHIVFKRSFSVKDFKEEYNSFKGNAYGLANILLQTAFLKPKMKSKKVKNLFYTGQLTTPGPGVPPSIISGEVVSNLIIKNQ